MKIALLYTLFAIVAIAANLGVQAGVTAVTPPAAGFWIALGAGTATGLVVKYLLDKHYIFRARHLVRVHEVGRSFLLYSLTGLLTTAVFWGFQIGFHLAIPTWPGAKYLGAVTGLTIGYLWKYRLDKRHAFAPGQEPLPHPSGP